MAAKKSGEAKSGTKKVDKGVTKKRVEDTGKLLELANEIVSKKLAFELGNEIDVAAAYIACLFSAIKLGKMLGKDASAIGADAENLSKT